MAGRGRRGKRWRIALAALAVAAGVVVACVFGYLSRSPVGRSGSVLDLIAFRPAAVFRCRDARGFWESYRSLPHYRRLEERGELAASPLAQAAEQVRRRGRVLGMPVVDVFDLLGDEVVVVMAAPGPKGRPLVACASRVRPAANLALGAYRWMHRAGRLVTPAGEWWMQVDPEAGVLWTKVGDVLLAGNDPSLVAALVASAQAGGGARPEIVDLLSDGPAPQGAVDVRPFVGKLAEASGAAAEAPRFVAFTVRTDSAAGGGPAGDGFRAAGRARLPGDTALALMWECDPAAMWQAVLGSMSDGDRDRLLRYVDDELCAVLGVERFEDEVIGELTGEVAVSVSGRPDPWLALAGGEGAPTVGLMFRMTAPDRVRRRLEYLLLEVAESINEGEGEFLAELPAGGEWPVHRGQEIHTITVRSAAGGGAATAGFFTAPDLADPGAFFVVASTSLDWLRRVVDVRETGEGALAWPRAPDGPAGDRTFCGVLCGDRVADLLAQLERAGRAQQVQQVRPGADPMMVRERAPLGWWVSLLGTVSARGRMDESGVIHAELWLSAEGGAEE